MTPRSEPQPTLVLNPPDDADFRAAASGLVESGIVAPAEIQDHLRRRWPRTLVRPRDLDGERATWYVYRDGHWVRPAGA